MLHVPVLLKETVDALSVRRGGAYIDGTLGRAGHTKEIIARGGRVLGIDRDDQALKEVGEIENLTAVKGCHGDIKEIAYENGWKEVDGILLDLGVSSPQLDDAGRGFSFQREGPLDMRMDRSQGLTAADIVNKESAENLAWIFRTYSEESKENRQRDNKSARVRTNVRDDGGISVARFFRHWAQRSPSSCDARFPGA